MASDDDDGYDDERIRGDEGLWSKQTWRLEPNTKRPRPRVEVRVSFLYDCG
jgi:hypothetical protein